MMVLRQISDREAQEEFPALLDEIASTRNPVIVERNGKAVAVVLAASDYDLLRQLQIARGWAAVDAIHEANRDKDPDEVYRDVTEVVEQVRQERYQREQAAKRSR